MKKFNEVEFAKNKEELNEMLELFGIVMINKNDKNYLHISYKVFQGFKMKKILNEYEVENIIFH